MCQCTCTEQNAPANGEVQGSIQNCGLWVWYLLHVTLLAFRIWRWFVDFLQICWHLLYVHVCIRFNDFLEVVFRCNGVAATAVKEVPSVRSGKTGCFADLPDVQLFKVSWFPEDSVPESCFKRVCNWYTNRYSRMHIFKSLLRYFCESARKSRRNVWIMSHDMYFPP